MEELVLILIKFCGSYFVLGAIFSIAFLWKGITKIDKNTIGTSKLFRVILIPGFLVFWPLFLFRWIKTK